RFDGCQYSRIECRTYRKEHPWKGLSVDVTSQARHSDGWRVRQFAKNQADVQAQCIIDLENYNPPLLVKASRRCFNYICPLAEVVGSKFSGRISDAAPDGPTCNGRDYYGRTFNWTTG